MKLAMGIYDSPLSQEQPVFYIDNCLSNIAVFGGPMSGKTTFIKTLLVRLHENMNQIPKENIYIIDFGGNIGSYGGLGNVCACFDNSNEENIKRVFKTIEARLEENAKQLGSNSFYSMVSKKPEKCPTHITLIIENINAFLADERYSSYQDRLLQFCRDGLSKGLTVVLTANDISGTGRLMANFGQKIAFEMPADSYFEIFNTKVNKPMRIPGRCLVSPATKKDLTDSQGFAKGDSFSTDNSVYECQVFLPFDEIEDEQMVDSLVQETSKYANENIMASFGDILTQDNITKYCGAEKLGSIKAEDIVVGLDYYDHAPVCVNLNDNRSIAIYGKRKFGKTNLLTGIIDGIHDNHPDARFVYLDDGRNEVKHLYEKYIDTSVRKLSVLDFMGYLIDEGYVVKKYAPIKKESVELKQTPFTVFVIQGKTFYSSQDSYNLLKWISEDMIGRAENSNYLFIFSDVRNISDPDMRVRFNNMLSSAFLLDNIGEFVGDRGNKSVFGEMDAKELKSEYAKCSVGDGYFYDIETDVLKKLRFIKFV